MSTHVLPTALEWTESHLFTQFHFELFSFAWPTRYQRRHTWLIAYSKARVNNTVCTPDNTNCMKPEDVQWKSFAPWIILVGDMQCWLFWGFFLRWNRWLLIPHLSTTHMPPVRRSTNLLGNSTVQYRRSAFSQPKILIRGLLFNLYWIARKQKLLEEFPEKMLICLYMHFIAEARRA